MKKWFKHHGLTIILVALFLASWTGQFIAGMAAHNEELAQHNRPQVAAGEYIRSGHFLESTFENWESEFLQMAVFVLLTVAVYQKGSSESKPLPGESQKEEKFPRRYFKDRPLLRKLYENSLSVALILLFLISFAGHLYGGWKEENLKRAIATNPQPPASLAEFLRSADFWFQSFQNWQSEFLSIAVLVVLTIFLRQKDSAQSKPVDAPHWRTEG